MPLTKDVVLEDLAAVTHGFVGADIASLAKESAMIVLRRLLPKLELKEDEPISEEVLKELKIAKKDFDEALKVVRPSAMREVLVETPDVNWKDVTKVLIEKAHAKGIKIFADGFGDDQNIESYVMAINAGIDVISSNKVSVICDAAERIQN